MNDGQETVKTGLRYIGRTGGNMDDKKNGIMRHETLELDLKIFNKPLRDAVEALKGLLEKHDKGYRRLYLSCDVESNIVDLIGVREPTLEEALKDAEQERLQEERILERAEQIRLRRISEQAN